MMAMNGVKLLPIGLKNLRENRTKMKDKRLLKIFITVFISFVIFGCHSIKILDSQKRFILNEKRKDKYYLIDFINENKSKIGDVPTLIIHKKDGEEMIRSDIDYNKKLHLKRSDFIRIEILSIEKSIALYGSAGKNGVLTISYYGKPNL